MPSGPEYHREYYQRNKERIRARRDRDRENANQNRRAAENRAFVAQLKEASPCTDCGVSYPARVMQFHHLRDKTERVSQTLARWSRERILEEIEKCVLLCANCHALRHPGLDTVEGATSSSEP